MLRQALLRLGVAKATLLVSAGCVALSVLITLAALLLSDQQAWAFILLVAVVCPACIAPPVTYSYGRLMYELESSQSSLRRELEERARADQLAQELDARLRQVLDHTNEAFCMTTPDFQKFYYVSSAYEKIWGRSVESLYASPVGFLRSVDKRDRRRVLQVLTTDMSNLEREVEYRIVRPDGEIRWIRSRVFGGGDPSGASPRIVGFSEDITDRRMAETELEAQRALGARADRLRSLGEMAAGIAHELNQPLLGVRTLAEHSLLAMDRGWEELNETCRERFAKIVEQVDRMVNIIKHVRLFAREAGKPEQKPVDINDVIRSSVELLQVQMGARGVEIECHLIDDLPVISANPFSLEEVVINVLSNARESIEERSRRDGGRTGGLVRIGTRLEEEPSGRTLVVEISDDGLGIPAEVLDRAFDPFYTTKPPEQGTGLGLSVSRAIVEEFGGTMDLRPDGPDGGATATLTFSIGGI